MKVLILSTAFSGMAQRVLGELVRLNHTVEQHYDLDEPLLCEQVQRFQPDVIVCPFLTQRIPDEVWSTTPCLIVHPGIEGDKGPSSLDWAISEGRKDWGVTLLQANANFDSGDIWGTCRFPMRRASKTSIYKREVTEAAIKLIKRALVDLEFHKYKPRAIDTSLPDLGWERPLMTQSERIVDWATTSTEQALCRLNGADSRPGVKGLINGYEVFMYGGVADGKLKGSSGEILAIYKGAFCCATKDGAVWIRQLKCKEFEALAPIKLPASMVLKKICDYSQLGAIQATIDGSAIEDISVERIEDTAYVYFNFYNGAFNTRQCVELKNTIASVKHSGVKKIVLMGGDNFWSNGIHLNCIEADADPALESWNNINAIDDLVLEIIESPHHITVAALRNNAGAGGAIMALACDEVLIRKGVVLNPHYQTMGLYGSEYWTYLLPKRVGEPLAKKIMMECQPMLADDALSMGIADQMFDENWDDYHYQLIEYCQKLGQSAGVEEFLRDKNANFAESIQVKPLSEYRNAELARMKLTFYDPSSEYHTKRRAFVYKEKAKKQNVLSERVAQEA
ncbi:MAG: putative two-component system hydrogenase maturation factor HypX/HoxX [Lentisphaeria bacterium]|jgi:putative two-component system hydrogenase maturation factor HypX/HoxX